MMNEVPLSWSKSPLGELCDIRTGDKDVNQGNPLGPYPFFTCAKDESKFDSYSFDGEAILVAGNGNFSVKKYEGKFEAYQRTYVLQNFKISFKYLYYFICGNLHQITKDNRGSTVRYIRIGNISDYVVPFPTLDVQEKIVKKIEELFSELDSAVENFTKAKNQLQLYRQSLLKKAFSGSLTFKWRLENTKFSNIAKEDLFERVKKIRDDESARINKTLSRKNKALKKLAPIGSDALNYFDDLPDSWLVEKLGYLTVGVEYGTSAKSKAEGKCAVLRMGNIQNNRFVFDDLVFTNDSEEIKKYKLKNGDVLFNRTNSPELVGKSAKFKAEVEAIFAGYLIRLNQIPEIVDADFLNYYLNSSVAKQYGNTVKTDGVNQSNINGEKLINYPFPYCCLEEQVEVVRILDGLLSNIDSMEIAIQESLVKAESFRRSILFKAFSGQLILIN